MLKHLPRPKICCGLRALDIGERWIPYVLENVYNLSPERYGELDIVLLLGVLYHLRDPLLAQERIWSV